MDDEINPGITKNLISAFEEQRFVSAAVKQPTHFQLSQTPQNVLIVFAHPDRSSFNGDLLLAAVDALGSMGHEVTVSDLHAMEFNACASQADFTEIDDSTPFEYTSQYLGAFKRGDLADDIKEEQEKVKAADLVILQFPLTWWNFPAIMKGWLERVLGNGFGYTCTEGSDTMKCTKTLQDKRVLLSFTTLISADGYSDRGMCGDMDAVLWPLQSVFTRCNMAVLPPAIHYAPRTAGTKACVEMISQWERSLKHVFSREPVRFIPFECFNESNQVPERDLDDASGIPEFGANPFQHFGRPIRVGNMRLGEGRWLGKKGKRSTRDSWVKPLENGDDEHVTNGTEQE